MNPLVLDANTPVPRPALNTSMAPVCLAGHPKMLGEHPRGAADSRMTGLERQTNSSYFFTPSISLFCLYSL